MMIRCQRTLSAFWPFDSSFSVCCSCSQLTGSSSTLLLSLSGSSSFTVGMVALWLRLAVGVLGVLDSPDSSVSQAVVLPVLRVSTGGSDSRTVTSESCSSNRDIQLFLISLLVLESCVSSSSVTLSSSVSLQSSAAVLASASVASWGINGDSGSCACSGSVASGVTTFVERSSGSCGCSGCF